MVREKRVLTYVGVILAGSAGLVGCAHMAPPASVLPPLDEDISPPPPPPPPPPPATQSGEIEPTDVPTVIGTELAYQNTYLGPIPTVTLVMKPYDVARNAEVCDQFQALPTAKALEQQSEPINIVPFRWLLDGKVTDGTSCDQLLAHYDYFRASQVLSLTAAGVIEGSENHPDISGRGPFMVEQYADGDGLHYVLVDMSAAEKGAELKDLVAKLQTSIRVQNRILAGGDAKAVIEQETGKSAEATKSWWDQAKTLAVKVGQVVCKALTSPVGQVVRLVTAAFIPEGAATYVTTTNAAINTGCKAEDAKGAVADAGASDSGTSEDAKSAKGQQAGDGPGQAAGPKGGKGKKT